MVSHNFRLSLIPFLIYNLCFLLCRIYEHIYGNTEKKDLIFQQVIEERFGYKKLGDFILMVHAQKITVANAKLVMMAIIDGDSRSPDEIAETQGLMGGMMTSDEVRDAVMECINS